MRLEKAASQDDSIGKLLREASPLAWKLYGQTFPPQSLLRSTSTGETNNYLFLSLICTTSMPYGLRIAFGVYYIFAEPDSAAAAIFQSRPPNCNPGSTQTFSLVKDWLSQCLASHQHEAIFGGSFKPSRLVQVRTQLDMYSIKLVESSEIPDDVRYVTLSYVWGGDQLHKLTKRGIEAKTGMSFEAMPRTIQDAIRVTAQMGLQFLWVDSLCICQDDDEEKAREIASMPFIYANSVVTIAAASSRAVTEGFLHSRSCSAIYIPFRDLGDSSEGYLGLLEASYAPEPLDTRAWTLQEYLLSTRVVEYGSHRLAFYCQGNEQHIRYVHSWAPRPIWPHQPFESRTLREAVFFGNVTYEFWLMLIENYTTRKITQPTDRILAIGSAAYLLAKSGLNGYIAGHWESKLPLDLLWTVKQDEGLPQPPNEYLGPSWSWVGNNGRVSTDILKEMLSSNEDVMHEEFGKVLAIDVRLANDKAPFGAVEEGILTIKGHIRPAFHFNRRYGHGVRPMSWSCADFEKCQNNTDFTMKVYPDTADFPKDAETASLSLCKILGYTLDRFPWRKLVMGLVLKKILSAGEVKRYVRVGTFSIKITRLLFENHEHLRRARAWKDDVVPYLEGFEEETIELV
ncbi:HET-domain-containing protein [Massarina eburnea CBS 473.64]|uniref:HET-domain-containing protein n=1 Tax=Massarina eburnea CBS 473.64 TaxID=1395130 RepID=A0A6A6RIF4_9PLEO|nr:HET-domain-containing protein [Massarina eburnea CBS 473.64]